MITQPVPPATLDRFRKYYQPLEPLLKKPKNRVYTTTVLSFLTVSLFVWYAIRPTIATILTLRREIQDNTVVNAQMEEKIGNLVEAQAAYQNVTQRLPILKQAVPELPETINLLTQLRNLANESSATISSANAAAIPLTHTVEAKKTRTIEKETTIPSTEITKSDGVTTTPISITLEGSYDSIKRFIDGLSSMRRIVTITDMAILPKPKSEIQKTGDNLTISLKLVSYSLNE